MKNDDPNINEEENSEEEDSENPLVAILSELDSHEIMALIVDALIMVIKQKKFHMIVPDPLEGEEEGKDKNSEALIDWFVVSLNENIIDPIVDAITNEGFSLYVGHPEDEDDKEVEDYFE